MSKPNLVFTTTITNIIALRDNPTYPKALHRRAQANENINTWATLQAALDGQSSFSFSMAIRLCHPISKLN